MQKVVENEKKANNVKKFIFFSKNSVVLGFEFETKWDLKKECRRFEII